MNPTNHISHLRNILIILLLALPLVGRAQRCEYTFEIRFAQDKHIIDTTRYGNAQQIAKLRELFDNIDVEYIERIEINSYTSPEGGEHHNNALSLRRSESMLNYLQNIRSIPDSLLTICSNGTDWQKLKKLVDRDKYLEPYRDGVLQVIDNVPVETWRRRKPSDYYLSLVDSREKHLMDLRGGRPYNYIYDLLYPLLRRSTVVTVYYRPIAPIAPLVEFKDEVARMQIRYEEPIVEVTPIIALKTNLLFDAATVLNIEAELPIGDYLSLMGEWNFPWWVAKDNGSALQVLSVSLEGRYWLGNRTTRPKLTGWFLGLYAGGGLYDLQWNDNGYQGEFFIAAGMSGGYSHTINKSGRLRLEYSVGIGYLNTDYRYYEGRQENKYLVWQYDGRYTWFGPTKAKVSLSWMITKTKQRGGRR